MKQLYEQQQLLLLQSQKSDNYMGRNGEKKNIQFDSAPKIISFFQGAPILFSPAVKALGHLVQKSFVAEY